MVRAMRGKLPWKKPPYSAYELEQTVNRIERLAKLREKAEALGKAGEADRYTHEIEISQLVLNHMLTKVHRHAKS